MLNGFRRAPIALLGATALLCVAAAPASAKTKTASKTVCVGGGAIPNAPHTLLQVPVSLGKLPKKARITDVNAALRVTHPATSELTAYLASPAGKLAMLADLERTGIDADFGTGPGCGGSPTSWDDEAAGPDMTGVGGTKEGTFKPYTPLSVMDGGFAAGNFTFIVEDLDESSPAGGTVDGASVTVAYSYPVKKKKKKKGKKSAAAAKKPKPKFVNKTGTADVCTNFAVPISNNPPTDDRATINPVAIATGRLPKGATITDVDARVRMTHSYEGDVELFLVSPTGGIVPLWIGYNESEDDFGTGSTDCTGIPTAFDDEAPTSITAGTAPLAGLFRPIGPLSTLDGRQAAGTWTLYVNDHYTGDEGTLHAAGLNIDYRYRAKKKAKKK